MIQYHFNERLIDVAFQDFACGASKQHRSRNHCQNDISNNSFHHPVPPHIDF